MLIQKILPLAYDNSLSYYEQICKLTKTINELVSLVNGDVNDTLIAYINNKFDNLMINAIYDDSNETIYLKKGELK